MNIQDIQQQARWEGKFDNRTFPEADFKRNFKIVRQHVITTLLTRIPEWNFQGEMVETDLFPANTTPGEAGYNGEYPFPLGAIDLITVDISYDGTSYNRAKQYFVGDTNEAEETIKEMNAVATKENPAILIFRNDYHIRPLADTLVPGGVKLKITTDISDIADDVEIPDILPVFHSVYVYEMLMAFGTKYPAKMKQVWVDKRDEELSKLVNYYINRWRRDLKIEAKQVSYE